MNSQRFAAFLRVSGWILVCLAISAPVLFITHANNANRFVIRKARVFDGHKVLAEADI
jgi:hypothetical protein